MHLTNIIYRNAQADIQAIGRAHRIGQTRPVSVYRLTLQGTVEERILQVARQKLALSVAVAGKDTATTAKEKAEMQQGLQASVVRFGVTQFVSQKIVSCPFNFFLRIGLESFLSYQRLT
jgi:hypothetical protein